MNKTNANRQGVTRCVVVHYKVRSKVMFPAGMVSFVAKQRRLFYQQIYQTRSFYGQLRSHEGRWKVEVLRLTCSQDTSHLASIRPFCNHTYKQRHTQIIITCRSATVVTAYGS